MSPPPMRGRSPALKARPMSSEDHGDADRADRDRVAFAERSAHQRWHLASLPTVLVSYLIGKGLPADHDIALELAQVEVEERAVDRRPADLLQLDRQDLQGPVDLVPALVQVARRLAQTLDVAHERGPDADDELGGLVGQGGHRLQGAQDGVLVLDQPGHEVLELDDQLAQLLVPPGQGRQHVVEVGDQVADHLVAVGQGVGQRRGALQQRVEVAALTLEHRDHLGGELVDVRRGQRLEQRLEPVEQHREVESRLGALHRDRGVLRHPVEVSDALGQLDVALTHQVAVADRGGRALGDDRAVGDVEVDHRAGAVHDLDVLDAAHLDARDPDVVALDHAGRVGEDGLVVTGRGEADVADQDDEHAGRERGHHDEDDQLDQVAAGLLVEDAHPTLTSVPAMTGP